jgi:hypothetical protein
VVERKTTIPILSNFLIEAEDDRLNITATDLDQAIRTSAAVKVKKPGACTIPARKLYDYIKLLPEGEISIKLLDNHWVQIRSGRSNTKMVGMARANYPQVPEFPSVAATSIPALVLKTLINRTIFAISNEESRYTLNGALLVINSCSLSPRPKRSSSPTTSTRSSSASAIAPSAPASSAVSSPTSRPSCRATTPSSPSSVRASCRLPSAAWRSLPTSVRAPSACAWRATS